MLTIRPRQGVVSPDDLLQEIDEMINERHIKDHPLVSMIRDGKLSKDSLRGFAKQFYFIGPKPNPRPHCAIYGVCPEDPDIDEYFLKNVILEEAAGATSGTSHHLTLYYQFLEALGVTREEMERQEPIPEVFAFVNWRFIRAYQGDWLGALTGIAFVEGASAARNDILVKAFIQHYGFQPGSPGILFWEVHGSEVEEEHGDIGPVVVRKYATTEFWQNRVRESVKRSIDLQWLFFDGIQRAYVDWDPRYARFR